MEFGPEEREAIRALKALPTGSRILVIQAVTGAVPTVFAKTVRFAFSVPIGEAEAAPARRRRRRGRGDEQDDDFGVSELRDPTARDARPGGAGRRVA
jgi:hypothetical protein